MRAEMGKDPSRAPPSQLNLPPGFRFYPTDEELVVHYLCKKAASEPFSVPIIAEVELYKFDPWDLPERALFGEKEWYFFSPRDRKYPNGSRPNRAAGLGYWKATGTDKPISTMGGSKKVGVKKALVFYKGKAPKGIKTNWIMHEYRLADSAARSAKKKGTLRLDDWVLCRIYKKCSGAQKSPTTKERSESSCLDTVLSPTQVSDGNLDSVPEGGYAEKGSVSGHGMYKNGHSSANDMRSYKDGHASATIDMRSYPTRNVPELNLYMQQLQSRGFEVTTENPVQKYSVVKNEQQGTSSLEISNPESHVYNSRQTSSPDGSGQEDDAAESTFNLFRASFPAEQLNTFTQSLYGMDAGLLPSPTMQGQGSFASLLESDYSSIFPTSDYNLQMRPFSRGTHWDAKGNFSTM